MNMEFKRKLPIPAEIKEMYPISEEGMKAKKLNDQKLYKKDIPSTGVECLFS